MLDAHVFGSVDVCQCVFCHLTVVVSVPQAAQWQNTSQILSLHDPAQQQSYTCTHVEQTRMVGCSQKVICPGCSVSLWVIVCVCGCFCRGGYMKVGFCICPPVHACLKCPCLYDACQRSRGCCGARSGIDSRHCNKCWHSNLDDCNWSSRFDYNFILLCQGIVGRGVRLAPLLWSCLQCLNLH